MTGSPAELHRELLAAEEELEQARFREHAAWKRRNEAVRDALRGGLHADTVAKTTGMTGDLLSVSQASDD